MAEGGAYGGAAGRLVGGGELDGVERVGLAQLLDELAVDEQQIVELAEARQLVVERGGEQIGCVVVRVRAVVALIVVVVVIGCCCCCCCRCLELAHVLLDVALDLAALGLQLTLHAHLGGQLVGVRVERVACHRVQLAYERLLALAQQLAVVAERLLDLLLDEHHSAILVAAVAVAVVVVVVVVGR